jgi:hypothetical protein
MENPNKEEGAQKRAIYESLSSRRRMFIDRIGYDHWDPFQEPINPMKFRQSETQHATHLLVREFLRSRPETFYSAFGRGALECAQGIADDNEKYRGIYEFCIWRHELLQREDSGQAPGSSA